MSTIGQLLQAMEPTYVGTFQLGIDSRVAAHCHIGLTNDICSGRHLQHAYPTNERPFERH